MSRTKTQYRPVFNLAELTHLRDSLAQDSAPLGKSLHHYLSVYIAKVSIGLNSAAYTTQGRSQLAEALGFSPQSQASQDSPPNHGDSASYVAKLNAKVELGGIGVLSGEERYNLLAAKALSGSTLTVEEHNEGAKLELEVTGFTSGIFQPAPSPAPTKGD